MTVDDGSAARASPPCLGAAASTPLITVSVVLLVLARSSPVACACASTTCGSPPSRPGGWVPWSLACWPRARSCGAASRGGSLAAAARRAPIGADRGSAAVVAVGADRAPGRPLRDVRRRGRHRVPGRRAAVPQSRPTSSATCFARWDAGWYVDHRRGRLQLLGQPHRTQTNVAFFPAYPLRGAGDGRVARGPLGIARRPDGLVRGVHRAAARPVAARRLAACRSGAFTWALVYLFRLARDLTDSEEAATAAVALAATYPFAFFYGAVYTEGLFLLCATAAVYHFRRRQWAWAAVAGLVAGLSRPNGCLLSVPLGLHGARRVAPRRLPLAHAGRGAADCGVRGPRDAGVHRLAACADRRVVPVDEGARRVGASVQRRPRARAAALAETCRALGLYGYTVVHAIEILNMAGDVPGGRRELAARPAVRLGLERVPAGDGAAAAVHGRLPVDGPRHVDDVPDVHLPGLAAARHGAAAGAAGRLRTPGRPRRSCISHGARCIERHGAIRTPASARPTEHARRARGAQCRSPDRAGTCAYNAGTGADVAVARHGRILSPPRDAVEWPHRTPPRGGVPARAHRRARRPLPSPFRASSRRPAARCRRSPPSPRPRSVPAWQAPLAGWQVRRGPDARGRHALGAGVASRAAPPSAGAQYEEAEQLVSARRSPRSRGRTRRRAGRPAHADRAARGRRGRSGRRSLRAGQVQRTRRVRLGRAARAAQALGAGAAGQLLLPDGGQPLARRPAGPHALGRPVPREVQRGRGPVVLRDRAQGRRAVRAGARRHGPRAGRQQPDGGRGRGQAGARRSIPTSPTPGLLLASEAHGRQPARRRRTRPSRRCSRSIRATSRPWRSRRRLAQIEDRPADVAALLAARPGDQRAQRRRVPHHRRARRPAVPLRRGRPLPARGRRARPREQPRARPPSACTCCAPATRPRRARRSTPPSPGMRSTRSPTTC